MFGYYNTGVNNVPLMTLHDIYNDNNNIILCFMFYTIGSWYVYV